MKHKWVDIIAAALAVLILVAVWVIGTWHSRSYQFPISASEVESVTMYTIYSYGGTSMAKTTDRADIAAMCNAVGSVKVEKERPFQIKGVNGGSYYLISFRLADGSEYICGGMENGTYPDGRDQNTFYTSDGVGLVVSNLQSGELFKVLGGKDVTSDKDAIAEYERLCQKLNEVWE